MPIGGESGRLHAPGGATRGIAFSLPLQLRPGGHFNREFDAAVMFCEGAFPLMESDDKNFAILVNACAALRPGGKLLMTTLNALFPLFHSVKDILNANQSGAATDKLTFDLMTFRERAELTFTDDAGQSHTIATNERYCLIVSIHMGLLPSRPCTAAAGADVQRSRGTVPIFAVCRKNEPVPLQSLARERLQKW